MSSSSPAALVRRTSLRTVATFACVIGAWSLAHYASVHAYGNLCVPLTPVGFVMSPLVVNTPHCTALRWIIQRGAVGIYETWNLITTASLTLIASSVCARGPSA